MSHWTKVPLTQLQQKSTVCLVCPRIRRIDHSTVASCDGALRSTGVKQGAEFCGLRLPVRSDRERIPIHSRVDNYSTDIKSHRWRILEGSVAPVFVKPKTLSYSRSRSIVAGVFLEGSTPRPDPTMGPYLVERRVGGSHFGGYDDKSTIT